MVAEAAAVLMVLMVAAVVVQVGMIHLQAGRIQMILIQDGLLVVMALSSQQHICVALVMLLRIVMEMKKEAVHH